MPRNPTLVVTQAVAGLSARLSTANWAPAGTKITSPAAARLDGGGVEQGADVAQRLPQAPVRPPADQRGSPVGRVQAEDNPHCGGFPGAVGADESGDLPWGDGEGHAVQGLGGAEPLAEAGDFDAVVIVHADRSTQAPVSARCRSPTPG
jgi:hypothetical protein